MFNLLRGGKKVTLKERLDMYDMLIANMLAGNSIIEPDIPLNNSKLSIQFSNLASERSLTKYFTIVDFGNYIPIYFISHIRSLCSNIGVRVNVYTYSTPHKIRWSSPEIRNKLRIWKEFSEEEKSKNITVFDYDTEVDNQKTAQRITESTGYLNSAEKENKRTTMKVSMLIEIKCLRNDTALMNMESSLKAFKDFCFAEEIKYRELKINLMDWLVRLGLFSLKPIKEVDNKLSKKIMTDDILSWLNTYRQGVVGKEGCLLGVDVLSTLPVLNKFREDPEGSDNWLISAETGGGKSYFIKALLTWLLADNFVVTVLDYEGDEYSNLAYFLSHGNTDYVRIISMGKGSSEYFDPMPIGDLTGDSEIDDDLKQIAINSTVAMFRTMVVGLKGELSNDAKKVLSQAIRRVYDSAGVTENKLTWSKSKGLKLEDVYREIEIMVDSKELLDEASENARHKAAVEILDASSVYFEEGESKYGIFKNPISVDSLFGAKFIVFSFGEKGASSLGSDPVELALKQLSVASVSIQISNYCKYVRKCFNVKVWEEFQRWGKLESSHEIIINAITGGRKRGDVNFIVTNDLASLLDIENKLNKTLIDNIQSYAIGKIRDERTRELFCSVYSKESVLDILNKIGTTNTKTKSEDKWKHTFCVILNSGKTAVTKVKLPPEIANSRIFKSTNIQE